jgi:hypothetical protein
MRQAIHIALALLLVMQAQAQMIIVIKKPAAGGSPPTRVNTWQGGSPLTVAPTAGNLVLVMACGSGTPGTPTDNQSTTYTQDNSLAKFGVTCKIYSAPNVASGITTITVAGADLGGIRVAEYNNMATASVKDVVSTDLTTGGGAFATDAQTTTHAANVLVGYGYSSDNASGTCSASWTTVDVGAGTKGTWCEWIVSSTASYQFNGTSTGGNLYSGVFASYKGQ